MTTKHAHEDEYADEKPAITLAESETKDHAKDKQAKPEKLPAVPEGQARIWLLGEPLTLPADQAHAFEISFPPGDVHAGSWHHTGEKDNGEWIFER